MRGRKPKPERLRVLDEETVRVVGGTNAPKPPKWLKGEGKAEWKRVVDDLAALGLIANLDATALGSYCERFALWRRAKVELDSQGFTIETATGTKTNPLVKVELGYALELRRLAAEFGFTPASRSRIALPRRGGKEEDDFENFLGSEPAHTEQIG